MTDVAVPAGAAGPAPAVSVIIPAFNAAGCLARAVASALAQEGLDGPVQVVIVDDASTDATAAEIARLVAAHPQVEGHANPRNLGPADTRNRAIAAARAPWVAVLDADDAFEPGRLARLIATAEAAGLEVLADLPCYWDLAAGVAAPVQLPDRRGTVDRLGLADFLQPDAETGLDLGLLKPIFRRRLAADGHWRYPGGVRHGEDAALYIALVQAGVGFGLLREAHYRFSTRIGAVSGRFSPGSVTEVDYPAVAAQVTALRDRLAADGTLDARIAGLIEARLRRLERLNRIHGWTVLRKGEIGRLRRWLAQHPGNRAVLWQVLRAKLGGHRGLPD